VDITVYEPFRVGSGHVWRRDQSRQFLMNTPSTFPTVMADERTLASAEEETPGRPEPAPSVIAPLTFDDFRRTAENIGADLTDADVEELRQLGPTDYPRRALYGAYLEHVAASLRTHAPEHVTVEHVQAPVDRITQPASPTLRLHPRGLPPRDFDRVILAIGHVEAQLNPVRTRLQTQAGSRYYPPSVPCDVDWGHVPAGVGVVIKGMGLNFFDLLTEMTQGRGGEFHGEGVDLTYVPSGREPRILALSRRGLPYAAKPDFSEAAVLPELAFATRERLGSLGDRGPVRFMDEVWPLLAADALLAFEEADARRAQNQARLTELESLRVQAALNPEEAAAQITALHGERPRAVRFDIERLAKRLVGREFVGREEHAAAVLNAVEADARSARSADTDPTQHAVFALNEARWVLKESAAQGLLTDASWHKELRGWFEPLIEGLASGPPSRRIAELAGLIRAGVVTVSGPSPSVEYDDAAGRFIVTSPWVKTPSGEPVVHEGELFIEAMMPANKVQIVSDPLVVGLLEERLARPRPLVVDGAHFSGTGFDVEGPSRRVVGEHGPVPGLHCLGLQLSSVEWGTAIAAKNGGTWLGSALTIADADAIARDVLGD
jgi:hypothetical protein